MKSFAAAKMGLSPSAGYSAGLQGRRWCVWLRLLSSTPRTLRCISNTQSACQRERLDSSNCSGVGHWPDTSSRWRSAPQAA